MDSPKFLEQIQNLRKGTFTILATRRPCKVRKNQEPLFKVWVGTARPGCQYDNLGVVKEGREDGTLPEENAGLPYGEWHTYPYVIIEKGEFQYRWTVTGGQTIDCYYTDSKGNRVSVEQAKEICLASEFPKTKKPKNPIINLKEKNIIMIDNVFVG